MTFDPTPESLSNLLSENRTFAPTPEFAAQANAKADMYEEAERDQLAFWEKQASALHWHQKWNQVLDWQPYLAYLPVCALTYW